MTHRGGDDDKRKNLPFVIPTERSDEGSPNAANRLMRYLPAVDMTKGEVDMTHRGGDDDKRKNLLFVIPNERSEDDCMGKGCSCNPVAFPPSMVVMQEVRCQGW